MDKTLCAIRSMGLLQSVADAGIAPRDMGRAMFRFCRAQARQAWREFPASLGYYGAEYDGARVDLASYLFPRQGDVTPQSPRLRKILADRVSDPLGDDYFLSLC